MLLETEPLTLPEVGAFALCAVLDGTPGEALTLIDGLSVPDRTVLHAALKRLADMTNPTYRCPSCGVYRPGGGSLPADSLRRWCPACRPAESERRAVAPAGRVGG